MAAVTLDPEDLVKLTGGKKQAPAQARELDHLGVPYGVRRDGSLVVLTAVVTTMFGGTVAPPPTEKEPELSP